MFIIKRGMVFFLEKPYETNNSLKISCGPDKKRPYIVLSNDKCNETSPNIHVAPIFTATEDSPEKWYRIPFKSTCGRNSVVDIASTMLVSKELFTEADYSYAISQYTINNHNLMQMIAKALARQFAIEKYVSPVSEPIVQPTASMQMPIPTINLNINVNGFKANPEDVTVEATYGTPKVEVTTQTEVSKKEIGQRGEKGTKGFRSKPEVTEFVKNNLDIFGGNLSIYQVAEKLGITDNAVYYHINKIKGNQKHKDKDSTTVVKKGIKVRKDTKIPVSMFGKFLKDYESYTVPQMIELYKGYGFTTPKSLYNYVWKLRKFYTETKKK